MLAASQAIFLWILAAGLLLLLLLVIGIYVYGDASRRRMNPVLWTLVAVLGPVFTGFIIYLLARSHFPDLICPVCRMPVEETYVVCPGCGARLKRVCTACRAPVEEDWIVCPRCAEPLSKEGQEITPPLPRKDRVLIKVLVLVFSVPLLLFVLLCVLNLSAVRSPVSMSSIRSCTEEDMAYYQELPEIRDWLSSVQEREADQVYVLRYRADVDSGYGTVKKTVYLIYRPLAGYTKKIDAHRERGFLNQTTAVVCFEDTFDPGWSHTYFPLTCVMYCEAQYVGLDLIVDGQKLPYELQESDTDPSLNELEIPERETD